ncbi:MAG: N-acetyl-gamma-glutamyl-phosphate reductase [Bacteroidota bacterium]
MKESFIKVGIIGAAGYTAGELLRLLIHHQNVGDIQCQSNSQAGRPVAAVHTDLVGDLSIDFVKSFDLASVDVLFLCKGHGESRKFLEGNNVPPSVKIIDLSHDYRLASDHNPFVYGLPEMNKERIKQSDKIANPGCFATAIQLGLLPAAAHDLIKGAVHTSGITGSTGAGQSLSATSHFSWRNNNISVYKAFVHQHLSEVGESLSHMAAGQRYRLHFIPYRGNFTRGIIITSYFVTNASLEEATGAYQSFYEVSPFTHLVNENPNVKQVVNTNKALVYLEKHEDTLMVISVIDNLLKGASGQALQNMNLLFGLDETAGLQLKSSAF